MKKIIIAGSVVTALGEKNTLLGRSTVSIQTAGSSEEILNLHGVHRADLIITEFRLPFMKGRQLCSAIRGNPDLRKVSIIMVCEGPEELEECRDIHANSIIPKPIDPAHFFSTISELLVIPRRKNLRVLLRGTIKGGGEGSSFFGMSHNISISGMLLDTDREFRKGDRFTCTFSLAHVELKAKCAVIRAVRAGGRYECGVAFVNLDTKSMIIIEQFVKSGIRH